MSSIFIQKKTYGRISANTYIVLLHLAQVSCIAYAIFFNLVMHYSMQSLCFFIIVFGNLMCDYTGKTVTKQINTYFRVNKLYGKTETEGAWAWNILK